MTASAKIRLHGTDILEATGCSVAERVDLQGRVNG
jgi:hypothetical protein